MCIAVCECSIYIDSSSEHVPSLNIIKIIKMLFVWIAITSERLLLPTYYLQYILPYHFSMAHFISVLYLDALGKYVGV